MGMFDITQIKQAQDRLAQHPLLTHGVTSIEDLRIFMQYHVWAVWDFMSLLKGLQHELCPSGSAWVPIRTGLTNSARLINEIVLGEESDLDRDQTQAVSHFDLYVRSMYEVGADTGPITSWAIALGGMGRDSAEHICAIPPAAREFIQTTRQIQKQGLSAQAGAFAWGRETLIPKMFQTLRTQLNLNQAQCPDFLYYLDRHIEVDEEKHGPASIELVTSVCNNLQDLERAKAATLMALDARQQLWTAILEEIELARNSKS